MSDENVGSSQGRWDHLLREIPTKPTKQKSPSGAKQSGRPEQSRRPEQSEGPLGSSASPQNDMGNIQADIGKPENEMEENVLSVSEINKAIKKRLEGEFTHIWVKGELSNFKPYSSGHWYFSLKDEKAQIKGLMFKGFNSRVKFEPENGMEVLIRGKITVYEPRGDYNLYVEHMEPVGAGALQKAFEQLKAKLSKEGLFSEDLKKPIPEFPKKVGVVTSPTGAAIQDILNVLGRRSKRAHVTVIPARVQGDGAAAEITRGIELANQVGGFDVLIVGRGGGSIEDLWCFNEESVARAIAQSEIPIISAVGHEIDFTIADFVADLRAPTPSAAAEVVAKSEAELIEKLQFYSKSLRLLSYQKIKDLKSKVAFSQKRLIDPRKSLRDSVIRMDDLHQRLVNGINRNVHSLRLKNQALVGRLKNPRTVIDSLKQKNLAYKKLLNTLMGQKLKNLKSNYNGQVSMLDSLSPLRTVDRGYAIVRAGGKLVPDLKKLKEKSIEVELRDGFIEAEVKSTKKKEQS